MPFVTSPSVLDDIHWEFNLEKLLQERINEFNIPSNTHIPIFGEDYESTTGGEGGGIMVLKRVGVEEVKERDASKNHESRSHLNPLAARAALALFRSNSSQKPELSTDPSTEANHTKMSTEPISSEAVTGKRARIKRKKADGANTEQKSVTRICGRKSEKREIEKEKMKKKNLVKKKGTKSSPRLNFLPRLRSQKKSGT